MTKIKEVHLVYVTIGEHNEWDETEMHILHTLDEVSPYQSDEFKEEQLKIGGVYFCQVDVSKNVTDKELREILTVEQYLKIYPDLKGVIDNYFKQ